MFKNKPATTSQAENDTQSSAPKCGRKKSRPVTQKNFRLAQTQILRILTMCYIFGQLSVPAPCLAALFFS